MIKNRKFNFINKKTVAGFMCAMVCLSAPQMAFAAPPTHNASVEVNIGTQALVIDFTVPGTASFAFNADGSNTIPENFTMTNHNKIASFYLKDLTLNAGASGWQVASDEGVIALDEKTIKLKMGLDGKEKPVVPSDGVKNALGTINYNDTDFVLAPEKATTMSFLIERPIYTEAIKESKAFDMSLDFEMK